MPRRATRMPLDYLEGVSGISAWADIYRALQNREFSWQDATANPTLPYLEQGEIKTKPERQDLGEEERVRSILILR